MQKAINDFAGVPGRIEFVPESEKFGFKVIVDYAFEPVALGELYKVVELLQPKRIIQVCGNTGGGRDKPDAKARLIANKADLVIVTNEDPYNDDPQSIVNSMASIVEDEGKHEGANLFKIFDREEAIKKAINMADTGDIVLITGKGSEQKMCVAGGKMVDWDDRQVAKSALKLKA